MKGYKVGEKIVLVDPSIRELPLIKKFNPDFNVRPAKIGPDFIPNRKRIREIRTGYSLEELAGLKDSELCDIHQAGLAGLLQGQANSATLFDVKIELAKREYSRCFLCGHECGVNRLVRQGVCGLSEKAYVADVFVHVNEEEIITPSFSLKLMGCSLDCMGCQSWEIIHLKEQMMEEQAMLLDPDVWNACQDANLAKTVQFVGGNPDESLLACLQALQGLPEPLNQMPLVWNTHNYGSGKLYEILEGIVDVYLPDFKGCSECVEKISKVNNYWDYATHGIKAMVSQHAWIIVRILILPGHIPCCHKPTLKWLSQYKDKVWISLLQYIPDYKGLRDSQLGRPTSDEDMERAKELTASFGLRNTDDSPELFWQEPI